MTLALDHLILAGPDLDRMIAETTRTVGAAPVVGGRHPGQGTRNALVGIRGGAYLELMAPDPEGERGDFLASIDGLSAPQLHAWCVRVDDADAVANRIEATGATARRLTAGRDAPGGERLEWELIVPMEHAWAGAAPFFIDWRGSRHPASSLAADVRLRTLSIGSTRPDDLRSWLRDVGIGVDDASDPAGARLEVAPATSGGLRADFVGRRGPFALRGTAGGIRIG